MKYMKKKKLIAVMALLIVAVSFGGCNSSNTAAAINSEVTSSEIVSSAPVSSEVVSSKEASSEAVSSAPVSSEEEKPESGAVSSEAATSSVAEAHATSSEPAMSSAPTAVSQPAASSVQAVTSESAVTSKPTASTPVAASQPVSSTASSAPVESVAQTSSAPPAQTASAPTQQSGSTKAFEDMTIEEQDQWLLDQLNEQLGNIEAHEYGREGANSAESTQPAEGTGDVYEAIRLINEERVKAGLNELEIDDTMMEMAAVRAQETVIKYDHIRPNGSSFGTIFDEFGYNFCSAVENIYGVPDSASKAVSGWMKSPGHKANILDTSITHIGVGYCFDENSSGKHYWVMLGAD